MGPAGLAAKSSVNPLSSFKKLREGAQTHVTRRIFPKGGGYKERYPLDPKSAENPEGIKFRKKDPRVKENQHQ